MLVSDTSHTNQMMLAGNNTARSGNSPSGRHSDIKVSLKMTGFASIEQTELSMGLLPDSLHLCMGVCVVITCPHWNGLSGLYSVYGHGSNLRQQCSFSEDL